jgi:hypothetical protein
VDDTEADGFEGAAIVNAAWVGTGVFVGISILATIAPDALGGVAAVVDILLFFLGCAAFLWAYGRAVSRSRTDAIGIGGLFFLQGSAPKVVRDRMRLALALEVVTAVACASIRPFTSLAFGVLVPVYGLGLSGLWGARYGTFAARAGAGER